MLVTLIFTSNAVPGAVPTPNTLELGPEIIQLEVKSPVVLGEIIDTSRSTVSPGLVVFVNGTEEGALKEFPVEKISEYAVVQSQVPEFLIRQVLIKFCPAY